MAGLTYPYDWGFIPSTEAEDGDPLDVLVIHDAQTYPGVVLRCRPVGILEVEQSPKARRRGMTAYLRYLTAPPSRRICRTSVIFQRAHARSWSSSSAPRTRSRTRSSNFWAGAVRPAQRRRLSGCLGRIGSRRSREGRDVEGQYANGSHAPPRIRAANRAARRQSLSGEGLRACRRQPGSPRRAARFDDSQNASC